MSSRKTSPPVRHRAGLQHQLRGFRNRHEEARDVRMRHRDRSAVIDLLEEQRHDRTRRSEHIAEPHHREARADQLACIACSTISASRFDAPITLVVRTALSVEIRMKFETPASSAASAA